MSFQLPSNATAPGTTTGGFSFTFSNSNKNVTVVGQASKLTGPTFDASRNANTSNTRSSFPSANSAAPTTVAASTTTNITSVPVNTVTTATFSVGGTPIGSTSTTNTVTQVNFAFGSTGEGAIITTSTTAAPILSAALSASSVPSTTGFASLSTSTKTTDSSSINATKQLSYTQLEECINKWTLELEEQEKNFIDQATQINAWDRILISNNQKILELNEAVQKVKHDQQSLEQELEFIETQQKEVQETMEPLQKQFMKMSIVDMERSQKYYLAESLDAQLKQMTEDLKELVDNLNENSKYQGNADPIIQIGKILNAHMESLQWIERSTNTIAQKLDEITKMHENYKKNAERSFRAAYYN